tara:strand:- start:270 stop:626 length:357 start_codon:yes stop_codon:yes gene_type:complete
MSEYKYFKITDFDCKETSENEMQPHFVRKLDELREKCGFPFYVTSGYRSANHSLEKVKKTPGQHSLGLAADVYVSGGRQRMQIVKQALAMGCFHGIGVSKAFVHVDMRDSDKSVMWSY